MKVSPQTIRCWRVSVQQLLEYRPRMQAAVGRSTCDHSVQRRSDPVDVHTLIGDRTARLFWRHVGRRAYKATTFLGKRLPFEPRDTEIDHACIKRS